jgi:hypothetical protein
MIRFGEKSQAEIAELFNVDSESSNGFVLPAMALEDSAPCIVLGQELGSSYKSLGRSCHDFKPA